MSGQLSSKPLPRKRPRRLNMKLGTKFSLTTVAIVVVLCGLLEFTSLFVFSRKIHALNKELFAEKLDRLVLRAYEEDELFFEGIYGDIKEGQRRVLSKLDSLYRNQKDPVTFPFIVDTAGKIVVHPAESRWKKAFRHSLEKGNSMFNKETLRFMLQHKEGEFEYADPDEGVKKWIVFKTYEPWKWIFCMTTSTHLLNKTVISFIQVAVLISVFMIILSVFVVLAISRRYTKPIRLVILKLQEIAQGQIEEAEELRVLAQSNDENGMLVRALNKMSEDLKKVTVSRDELVKEIEERKRLETMVLQSEKMAAVGQLAGGVAHEINNPLGVMLGFAQSLVRRISPGDPMEMPLKSIEREAVRCKNLVQDLLTFSRMNRTDKEPIDLNETIEGSLSLILAQARVKNATLVKEFSSDLPRVSANKNQIQQVIVNLCNNAMDAMPDGGKLFIRTRKAQWQGKAAIEIQIEDTGSGIPKEIQSKIFEPFFTTKAVGKGTGLGLSLVYEIIQKHEGQIKVDSEVGQGTVFSVILP